MAVLQSDVIDALRKVIDPDLHKDVVSLGFIEDVTIEQGAVSFTLCLTTPACPVRDQLKDRCVQVVREIAGVERVEIELTAKTRSSRPEESDLLRGVNHVIAIASGKGGVGKSTVSVNVAVALAAAGAKVGLLDADVYGPSIPLMMGAQNDRPFTRDGKIVPIMKFGVQMMSIGFLLEEGQAVLWRGPMVAGTVKQLLSDVDWGELDYLLVDLPPGTGDAPMSLAQLVPLTGVVIVATPQHVAANIAGKSAQLFQRLKAPLLGVIENMGEFVCSHCGERTAIFAGLSGVALADRLETDFLGSVPLDPAVCLAGDQGRPSVLAFPSSVQASSFRQIAGEIARRASTAAERKSPHSLEEQGAQLK